MGSTTTILEHPGVRVIRGELDELASELVSADRLVDELTSELDDARADNVRLRERVSELEAQLTSGGSVVRLPVGRPVVTTRIEAL